MSYHSNNGLVFERLDDGQVRVSYWLHGAASAERADQVGVDVLVRDWTMTPPEWASVVAFVSAQGETGETHRQALDFHGGAS